MTNIEKRKAKLDRMIEAVARERVKILMAEQEEKRKRRRAEIKQREAERRADAHRKIELGGLVIAAGVEDWDPAEIVGALLIVSAQSESKPELRANCHKKGLQRLEARKAARNSSGQPEATVTSGEAP